MKSKTTQATSRCTEQRVVGLIPRCPDCGRFMKANFDRTKWKCSKVFWDDYSGGYEHG